MCHCGHIDIGETKIAVAAKRRSVDLLESTMTNEKWCLDCPGWLGWLGWLAWLSWLHWQGVLEASEGPTSEQKCKKRIFVRRNVCLGSRTGIISKCDEEVLTSALGVLWLKPF